MNRIEPILDELHTLSDQDDQMMLITETLKNEVLYPEPGNYYTFIYKPKTPDISYDEFPLIACMELYKWGFRGLNFHWRDYRNYTWEEVIGKLHVVNYDELDDLISVQYGKFRLNK
jgi:hypothetical protein